MKKIIEAINEKIAAAEKHFAENRAREEQLVIEGRFDTDDEDPRAVAEYERLTSEDLWLHNYLSTTRSAVCALEAAQRFELEL